MGSKKDETREALESVILELEKLGSDSGIVQGEPTMKAVHAAGIGKVVLIIDLAKPYKLTPGSTGAGWANIAGMGKSEKVVDDDGRTFTLSGLRVGSPATKEEIEEFGVEDASQRPKARDRQVGRL